MGGWLSLLMAGWLSLGGWLKARAQTLQDLVEAGEPERIATNLQFTEGPVWHPDGYLLFSDIPANRIYRWEPGKGLTVFREPSGNSNGLTLDREGRLIACEHGNRRVSRTEADGRVVSLAERYQGKRLNSPNDVVVRSDGSIYFTDPPYGVQPEQRELDFQGVYRLSPDGTLTLLVGDFERPNGLCFSPDEKVLYIADTARRHVRAFEVLPDGSLGKGRIFADVSTAPPSLVGGPDGMKVDEEGNLYVTNTDGVWVISPEGKHLGTIAIPERPANCAFGDADRRSLYITARTSVYRVRVKVPGITPWRP